MVEHDRRRDTDRGSGAARRSRAKAVAVATTATPQQVSPPMRNAWATALGRVPCVTAFGCRLVRLQLAGTASSALPQIAAVERGRPATMAGAAAVDDVGSRSAPRSRVHHRPRCRDTSRSTPAWSAQAAVARRAGSWCAGRSALPWSGASSASRNRRGPARARRPSARGSGRTVGSPDEVSHAAGWGTGSPPASARPA